MRVYVLPVRGIVGKYTLISLLLFASLGYSERPSPTRVFTIFLLSAQLEVLSVCLWVVVVSGDVSREASGEEVGLQVRGFRRRNKCRVELKMRERV